MILLMFANVIVVINTAIAFVVLFNIYFIIKLIIQ